MVHTDLDLEKPLSLVRNLEAEGVGREHVTEVVCFLLGLGLGSILEIFSCWGASCQAKLLCLLPLPIVGRVPRKGRAATYYIYWQSSIRLLEF